ncbi:MAG: FAD-dependent oxidoreductase [Chloroflexi bacterium]|uniref:FAD-dependent oxidoreductase n=1 Tax=Candidatus Flexifilum breve TaxID=3140694 RepID=UPI003135758E|nr:FAD-dependent oxidoreductase [Chloroflexota bacterium]
MTLGTTATPLRVAIIGSGPSAFYAAEHYLKSGLAVEIDMFERLPTPYGLVRGGVAPDHPKIKTVTKVYDRIAANPNFHFYGNVEFGRDLTIDDLRAHYHQVVFGVGAQTDRRMGIPGEDLLGSHPATEFVGWYNAHPDYRELQFDLSKEKVAVIGNGNVAMDVARILASTYDELVKTDIADYALEALKASNVKDIYIIGRRGPAQAAYTNPELKELGELHDADVIVSPETAELDPLSSEYVLTSGDRDAERNTQTLMRYSTQTPAGKSKRIHMLFLLSPTALFGTENVEAIELVKNELYKADDGTLRPRATSEKITLPIDLVFRSIGYKGVALPGVPFDERGGVIPNVKGRILNADKSVAVGEYAVGWIKRGPSGIIGTNKPDSQETIDQALEDAKAGSSFTPSAPSRAAVEGVLRERGVDFISFAEWQKLDEAEVANGTASGRPRVKFSRVDDMLNVVRAAREPATGD